MPRRSSWQAGKEAGKQAGRQASRQTPLQLPCLLVVPLPDATQHNATQRNATHSSMFDVTTFLIRWFFLSNLARDAAELQTLPCQPYSPLPPPPQQHQQQHQHQPQLNPLPHHHPTADNVPPVVGVLPRHVVEQRWRDDCLRGILSYPPGLQRALVLEALRVELVQRLAKTLRHSSHVLKARRRRRTTTMSTTTSVDASPTLPHEDDDENDDIDPYRDADVEILQAFGGGDGRHHHHHHSPQPQATLVLSSDEAAVVLESSSSPSNPDPSSSSSSPPPPIPPPPPSTQDVLQASQHLRDVKEYLPQLVGAVLRAPPPLVDDPHHVLSSNPIQHLRQALLHQCADDPGFGIDLCWLLEAEVGRTWKTLFEHRQQTGRRLIVVLPAEKAAVLAQIGMEKRGAFDWLQDAEQATAYGFPPTPPMAHNPSPSQQQLLSSSHSFLSNDNDDDRNMEEGQDDCDDAHPSSRLPSSLSLRRCSHFGDTMHLIDRLSKVSLDLRSVPIAHRLVRTTQSSKSDGRRRVLQSLFSLLRACCVVF